MLTEMITGPRAWDSASLDDRRQWYFSIPVDLLAALDRALGELSPFPTVVTSLQAADLPCGSMRPSLQPVRAALESGRGFVILDGIPAGRYSPQEMRAVYWLLGQLLGGPRRQNV
jgi:hypothetical protein